MLLDSPSVLLQNELFAAFAKIQISDAAFQLILHRKNIVLSTFPWCNIQIRYPFGCINNAVNLLLGKFVFMPYQTIQVGNDRNTKNKTNHTFDDHASNVHIFLSVGYLNQ